MGSLEPDNLKMEQIIPPITPLKRLAFAPTEDTYLGSRVAYLEVQATRAHD